MVKIPSDEDSHGVSFDRLVKRKKRAKLSGTNPASKATTEFEVLGEENSSNFNMVFGKESCSQHAYSHQSADCSQAALAFDYR